MSESAFAASWFLLVRWSRMLRARGWPARPTSSAARAGWCGLIFAVALGAGCRDQPVVRVELLARAATSNASPRLEIQAQVTGAQGGLRYKWFALSGQCEPQASDWPMTFFTFGPASKRDRIALEVWRGETRIAQKELVVYYDQLITPTLPTDALPKVDITITTIPPAELGGDASRADIRGTVTGMVTDDLRIVVYARAYDIWFVQPMANALHQIQPDHTWSTWTHTGHSYAALVVGPGFVPLARLDLLPQVGDQVLARAIVDGTPAGLIAPTPP